MRILALIGALAIIVAIGAAIFFFGGFYSVAESQDDPAIVSWALATRPGGLGHTPCNRDAAGFARRPRDRQGRRSRLRDDRLRRIVTEVRRTPIGPSGLRG